MNNKVKLVDEFGSIGEAKFYQPQDYLKLHENYKPSTNQKILGIVEGKSFVLDGVSRNGRYYPRQLWENALKDPEVKQMLKEKLMFGCIGHPENYTLDELLQEGKVSHIVTDIKLGKDGFGYAVYEILDTPTGRILETVLKAGSKLKVSTRGFGEFLNETKEIDGRRYQVINPKTFQLESIDFVIKPGIASVDVKLVEELEKNNKEDIEKLKESKIHLCEDGVCTIISEVEMYEKLKKENEKLQTIIKNLKKENEALQNKFLEDDEDISKVNYEQDEMTKEEKDIDFINTMIVSYIEYFLKDANVDKSVDEIKNSMLEYLDTPIEDLDGSVIDTLLERLEKYEGEENIYIENLKIYLEKLKNIVGEEKKSDEDKIKDIIAQGNEFISDVKTKELEEEFQSLIKDLTRKVLKENEEKNNLKQQLKKFKNSYFETLKLLKEEKNIRETQAKILNKKEDEYKDLLNLANKLEENISNLEEEIKIVENQKHKLEIEFKILKESKNEVDEKIVSKRVFEELNKLKKEAIEELEKDNKIYLELQEQKLKEKLKNNFEEKIQKLKEDLNSKNIEIEKLKENVETYKKNLSSLEEDYKLSQEEVKKLEGRIQEEERLVKEFQIKYLENLYKLDKSTIIETLNNSNDIEQAKTILETKQQKIRNSITEEYGVDMIIKKEFKENKKEKDLLDKLI